MLAVLPLTLLMLAYPQTADLLAKTQANKKLNDSKRLATSGANLARTRTVQDKTCAFPQNFFGCESLADKFTGGVKYIKEDKALECEVGWLLLLRAAHKQWRADAY